MESFLPFPFLVLAAIIILIFKHIFVNTLPQFRTNLEVTQLRELELRDIANLSESSTGNPPVSIFRYVYLRA
jgi:hypothetical protein